MRSGGADGHSGGAEGVKRKSGRIRSVVADAHGAEEWTELERSGGCVRAVG